METITIKEIAKLRDEIKEALKTVDKSTYSSTYGSENEYSGKGIYLGVNSILTDITYLVQYHNVFIKISTYTERINIKNLLANIKSVINHPSNLISYVDQLKVLLRSYNVNRNKERWEIFHEVNSKLLLQSDEFSTILKEVNDQKKVIIELTEVADERSKELQTKLEELQKEIETVEAYKNEIEEKSETLKSTNTKLEEIKEAADENLESIVNHLNEAKSNEKLIDGFAKKVQERENRLGELEQRTSENDKKLEEYETERNKVLSEAEQLIQDAKTALHYSTASGLSESFSTQHTAAKKWQLSALWIGGATFFILVAIGLGIWITVDKTTDLHLVIGRIALLPLPIVAAIFCANQYVKQKNIIEDYAYKMVLAKSIVGFSEQLKKNPSEDNGEYVHYMKVALEEIHKDPLRKRKNDSSKPKAVEKIESLSIKDVLDTAERLVKLGKE